MDLVTLVAACGLAVSSPLFVPMHGVPADCASSLSSGGDPTDRWTVEITAAARRFAVPEAWVRAVMRVESGGDPAATSPKGAMGLMQLMPATWAEMRRRYGLGADPYRPADNVLGGVAYLRELLDRYGAPDFLAAYNAGPVRLDDHNRIGRPLPAETRRYLAVLAPRIAGEPVPARRPALTDNGLFALRHDGGGG